MKTTFAYWHCGLILTGVRGWCPRRDGGCDAPCVGPAITPVTSETAAEIIESTQPSPIIWRQAGATGSPAEQ
jgi:hypothetical protein